MLRRLWNINIETIERTAESRARSQTIVKKRYLSKWSESGHIKIRKAVLPNKLRITEIRKLKNQKQKFLEKKILIPFTAFRVSAIIDSLLDVPSEKYSSILTPEVDEVDAVFLLIFLFSFLILSIGICVSTSSTSSLVRRMFNHDLMFFPQLCPYF